MDIETAIKIVKEYGKILDENPVSNIQGRRISLLPHNKDIIKEAVKVNLTYVGTVVKRDEKMLRSLKLCFLQLASFLPDSEVVPMFHVKDALNSDDVCHMYYRYLAESGKAGNRILEQTGRLAEELDEFCQDNGI
ncbi:MAG: hypothetical protein FJ264_05140 [Planctomycetes bacterium]|nr:hypothetical protein [Planctomycetota bacterium]